MLQTLQAIIHDILAAPIETAGLVLATIVIVAAIWALIKLVQNSSDQAKAIIETQRLHNETERRRNDERKEEAAQLREVVKLSDTQQKKIDLLEDHLASATAATGGAIKQVQELSKANDVLTADLKALKEAAELRDAEYKRRQEETDLKLAEANLKITTLENQRELDDKLIKQLKSDLDKAHKENLTALTTLQNANMQSQNAAVAWGERFELQHREIEALQSRVKQLETVAEERQAARDAARKERDEEVVKTAAANDKIRVLEQQVREMTGRLNKVEVATGPLLLPGKSEGAA